MRSNATSVHDYLAELPDDRREALIAVRDTLLAHLPLTLVGQAIAEFDVEAFVEMYEASRKKRH